MPSGFMWECSCGNTEYREEEPEECLKCGNLGTFMQMPEEIIQEREKDLSEEFEEEVKSSTLKTKMPKMKSKTMKSKAKSVKKGRKK